MRGWLALLAWVLALAACTTGVTGTTTTTGPVPTPTTTVMIDPATTTVPVVPARSAGWEIVADVPVTLTSGAVVEATDTGIVVVSTDWTSVIGFDGSIVGGEKPPVAPQPGCCGSVVGIPVGNRLILMDVYGSGSWVLDPETVTWDELGDRPAVGDILGSAVIGEALYVVNAAARAGGAVSLVSVLDLTTGEWSEVEQVPSGVSVGGVTTDGERLIVAGVLQDLNNRIIGESSMPVAYEYSEKGWHPLPDIPINGQASTVVWAEGAGLLAWNYDPDSALLAATGEWDAVGPVPMDAGECYPRSTRTEGGIVGFCGGLAYFDSATRSWAPIPISSSARYVAGHDSVYQLTPSGDATQLAVYELPDSGK